MLAKRGYRVGESTYAEWESGYKKQPAREAQPHLTALWGSEPPAEVVAQEGDIAAALLAQAAAISDLAAAIREDRDRVSPEGLRLFLEQLRSEGLLQVPDRPASNGVSLLPAEVES